jgi:cell wall integrity and stress response component
MTSTRVVTISGEVVTQTVTSTPMVVPDRQSAEANKSDDLSGGAIAGIVIGVLALLALLALAAFFLWRHHRNQKDPNNPHGYPEMATAANPRPRRNVSVLSKVGLLARSGGYSGADDDNNDPHSAGPSHSARHSVLYGAGGNDGVAPSSPLGPQSNASTSLYQTDSRRHSKPLVYDQRLNPSALFANADANGSRISMADNTDYSRPLDLGGGKLTVKNPDPRTSFESRL